MYMMEHLYLCIDPAIWSHVYEFSGAVRKQKCSRADFGKKMFRRPQCKEYCSGRQIYVLYIVISFIGTLTFSIRLIK